jgi:hypothetical protein
MYVTVNYTSSDGLDFTINAESAEEVLAALKEIKEQHGDR